jgi:hypothetical protein
MAARASGAKAPARARTPARQSRPAGQVPPGPPPRNAAEAAALHGQGNGAAAAWDDSAGEVMDPRVHGFEPVRLTTVPAAERDEVRVPLFYVDGTPYTVPAEPGMETALEALHITRKAIMQGFDADTAEALAMDYVFEVILGTGGYAALRGIRKLQPQAFSKICAIAHRLTIGALELPKDAGSG